MPIIATEALAKSIGGSSASVTANLMVTRVRAVALGCSIRNSYSDAQLVCLRDLYKVWCNEQCTGNHAQSCKVVGCVGDCSNCTCQSTNCTCNSTCDCTGGHCDCNTTCTCTTTGCSCTSGNCNCEVACDGECANCTCNNTNCTCNSHCKCNTNWVINCNGQEPDYRAPGVSASGNTSTCTGECTSVCNNCRRLCSTNECSSVCCDSSYYQGCGCNGCHGGYDGWGFGCYEVWKCNRECDPYGISCSCTNNNLYKCSCNTTCACTTTGCSCTDLCVCEAKCDGECANCKPNACVGDGTGSTYECTCNTTCDCTGGHWSSSYCSCDTTCACYTVCTDCPSNG